MFLGLSQPSPLANPFWSFTVTGLCAPESRSLRSRRLHPVEQVVATVTGQGK
jgi:hypothetical protein